MTSSRTRGGRPIFLIILVLLTVLSMAFGGIYYQKYQDLRSESAKTVDQKNAELLLRVSKVYSLPTDEEPTVILVAKDPSEFSTEQEKNFAQTFRQLKKDDYILIYANAQKAIQYRDSEGKVIDTATISINKGASIHIIGTVESQNGTQTKLESEFTGRLTISSKATSTNSYTGVSVFDKSGENGALANELASSLGGVVITGTPAGETIPDMSDIVIIVGSVQSSSGN